MIHKRLRLCIIPISDTPMTKTYSFIIALLYAFPLCANTIYVNLNATGQNDGSSWINAFSNLNNALTTAQYGDEIWVAKGAYFPYPASPILSFVLVSGTKLLGGFNGTETSVDQRDWASHETILYGDEPGFTWLNVVYCENTDSSTLLDGFTIRGGHADITIWGYTCNLPNNASCAGGGLYLYNNNPATPTILTVQHCRFINNSALRGGGIAADFSAGSGGLVVQHCYFSQNGCNDVGGGISIETGQLPQHRFLVDSCLFEQNTGNSAACISLLNSNSLVEMRILNSVFRSNASQFSCAGIYMGNGSLAKPVIENCMFINNIAGGNMQSEASRGGAILGLNFQVNSSAFINNRANKGGAIASGNCEMVNCLIRDNYSKTDGGALWLGYRTYLQNCTFYNNNAGKSGGAIYNVDYAKDTIINCIFSGNTAGESGDWMASIFGNDYVDYSVIDVADCEALKDGLHPMYDTLTCGANMFFNVDPMFVDTAAGDFRLRGCSPLLNQGDSAWTARFGLQYDLVGNSRWLDGRPDIGAYETPRFRTGFESQDIPCFGEPEGTVMAFAEGGIGPYSYSLGNNLTDSIITGLYAGNYSLRIQDSGLCADTFSVDILQPDSLHLEAMLAHSNNSQQPNGSIIASTVSGGVVPYQLEWSTGSTQAEINNLSPGTYALSITDGNNCVKVWEFEVLQLTGTVITGMPANLVIYPNPTIDWVQVRVPEYITANIVELVNTNGETLVRKEISTGQQTIDLSLKQFESAVYSIILKENGKIVQWGRLLKL